MVIMPKGYREFSHYRSYNFNVGAQTLSDFTSSLPSVPCYFLGFYANAYVEYVLYTDPVDSTYNQGLSATTGTFIVMSPVKIYGLRIYNANTTSIEDCNFLLGWD